MNEDLTKAFRLFRKWQTHQSDISVMVMAESQQMIINLSGQITVDDNGIMVAGDQREFRFSPQPNMTFSFGDNNVGIGASGYRVALFLSD